MEYLLLASAVRGNFLVDVVCDTYNKEGMKYLKYLAQVSLFV